MDEAKQAIKNMHGVRIQGCKLCVQLGAYGRNDDQVIKKNAKNKGTCFVHRNYGHDKRTYKEILKEKTIIQENLANAKTAGEAQQ